MFEQGGRVHELDPANGREKAVPITVAADFPWMMPHWVDAGGSIANLALSPTGELWCSIRQIASRAIF